MSLSDPSPLLDVRDIRVHFPVHTGVIRRTLVGTVKAVDGVSFTIKRGETFSIVGESGCGKSTTAMAVLGMQKVNAGQVLFDGKDISRLDARRMRSVRRQMQAVFQDPFSSLNPRMKVSEIIAEPLEVHGVERDRAARRARVVHLMELTGLLPDMADRYPHEFSGGQRQRICIARALALEPDLIVCDEAVSALDVSIRAQILNLLMELQQRLHLAYLFISHDLSVVRHISDRVAVMYLGRIVETGDRDAIFTAPQHPYTQALLQAAPVADPAVEASRERIRLGGEPPSPRNPPSGCRFHPRCPQVLERCSKVEPPPVAIAGGGIAACHLLGGTTP